MLTLIYPELLQLGSALARSSRRSRIHTGGVPSNEQHSVADDYSIETDGNNSTPYVEERENLADIFAHCESFGERVSSTRATLYNVGAKVEAGVRVAFEEQKRKEALEIAKLKKAGHHVTSAGGLTPVSIKRVTSSELGGNALDLGNNNNNGGQDPGSPSKSTADILALSAGYGPSSDSAAALAAFAKDKERMTLHLKKMKMAAADVEVQNAMSHKAKMLKSLLAQDFYAQRDKQNREKFGQHKSLSSLNVMAADR